MELCSDWGERRARIDNSNLFQCKHWANNTLNKLLLGFYCYSFFFSTLFCSPNDLSLFRCLISHSFVLTEDPFVFIRMKKDFMGNFILWRWLLFFFFFSFSYSWYEDFSYRSQNKAIVACPIVRSVMGCGNENLRFLPLCLFLFPTQVKPTIFWK